MPLVVSLAGSLLGSLADGAMVVAPLVCVGAAAVMVAQSPTRRVRAAHLVMLAVMVVLAVAMGSVVAQLMSLAGLLVAGSWLLRGPREGGEVSCGLELVACAGLVALMAVGAARRTSTDAAGGHGMSMSMAAAAGPSSLIPLLMAGVVVAAWAWARRRSRSERGAWSRTLPAWSMLLAMASMTIA